MKNYPDVSIVVTNYNYSDYISRCIRSCLSQKNVNFEIIVVDDCSTDDSLKILKTFEKDIKLIVNEENMGVAASSNRGVEAARGQFFVRVDADDYISPDMCYFMQIYLETNHDAFCLACDYVLTDNHENIIERRYAKKDNISCGIMYRRDLLLRAGGYDPKMRHKEEEELRKRLGEYYNIHYLGIPFYRYRMHNTNKTKSEEYKTTTV